MRQWLWLGESERDVGHLDLSGKGAQAVTVVMFEGVGELDGLGLAEWEGGVRGYQGVGVGGLLSVEWHVEVGHGDGWVSERASELAGLENRGRGYL